MIQFKYNGKIYDTSNLTKKLKKLGITESDIELVTSKQGEQEEARTLRLYHFKNVIDGSTITSIYSDLSHLSSEIDISKYELYD